MKCPVCGAAELIHDTRDMPYSYQGETTILPAVTGDFCPACGESILDADESRRTMALMASFNQQVTTRTTKEVFDRFALPDEFSFAKTVVPVRLARHEGEMLVSRSQAKLLVMGFEHFKTVVLDFSGVMEIGQAFADEVFRVFARAHPDVELIPTNTTQAIDDMIGRAKAG